MPFKIGVEYDQPAFSQYPSIEQLKAYIVWLSKELHEAKSSLAARTQKPPVLPDGFAALGGKAASAKLTAGERKERASKAAKARWNKRKAGSANDS